MFSATGISTFSSTTSSSSSASSAMNGDPPIASTAFAQSFIVTELVMQWVNGFFSFMFFKVFLNLKVFKNSKIG